MKEISFSPPDITEAEIAEVAAALRSGWITTGQRTKLFEKEIAKYVGSSVAVALNSATAALELTLRILGVGPGDEVITSAYTYTASASVIQHVGAKIVLVDIQKDCFEMDYDLLEKAITKRTKVIIPVDLTGKICDYDRIYAIIERKKEKFKAEGELQKLFNRIIVLDDAAHAFGATWHGKMNGQIADFTCFSFHAVKNLTTGEGGAVVWKDVRGLDNDWLYHEFMLMSLHGQSKDAFHKTTLGSWEYDIVYLGYKCNMTDPTAALGLVQIKRYPQLLARRKEIISHYDAAFKPLGIMPIDHFGKDFSSTGHLYLARIPGITVEQRNEIILEMGKALIACNVHYKPLPMFTAYKNLGFDIKNYPNAYDFYHNEITLPLHTLLTDEEVKYIADTFVSIVSAKLIK